MANILTEKQRGDIERTWSRLGGDLQGVGFLIFKRLFDVTPELQQKFPKFKDVPRDQLESDSAYRSHTLNVVETVQVGVKTLNDISTLSSTLQELGKRHAQYGIGNPPPFDLVGGAVLWALEQGLGEEWTTEVKEAWITFYGYITKEMKTGMNIQ